MQAGTRSNSLQSTEIKLQRITYVEDEPDIRMLAELIMRELGGFEVDACSCGREALERTHTFNPDLSILDVMMPEMDGVQLYGRLREDPQLAHTPIIFMTAKAQPTEVRRYQELGAIAVVPKPFDPATLIQELQDIWQTHRRCARLA